MTSHPYTVPRPPRLTRWLALSGLLLLWALLAVSQGAVTSAITGDGTLGTTVTQSGRTYTIGGGTLRGSNLFQSFERFSVGTGDTATFTGPAGTTNILNRVTGGQLSEIDGRLRSTIDGANLFLLNPSGVLFGPNASLDVRGAFHVSTADVLRFDDGATFSAHLGRESVLTVAPPAAFGFLGNTPSPITVQGSALRVPEGKALSIVGGDLQVTGNPVLTSFGIPTLGAQAGRIQLASVASPGEVGFSPLELAPDLRADGFARLGRLELSQGALLDVSGNGGGTVLLRSGRLLVDRSSILANTLGDVAGASLALDLGVAADIVLTNDAEVRASPRGAGNGGNVVVHGRNLTLTDGAGIFTSSFGGGRGGDLTVTATEAVSIVGRDLMGNPSGLFSNAFRLGDGGRLSLAAPLLTMDGGAIEAGTVEGSHGNAGGAEVRGGRLTLSGGAQLSTSTVGSGRGGELRVMATEAISLAGRGSVAPQTGLFSVTDGSGDAGRLFVSAPLLESAGGRILGRTLGGGHAGDIELRVGRLVLTEGAQIFNGTGNFVGGQVIGQADGLGRGGNLTVVATDSIFMAGHDQLGLPSGLFSSAQIGRGDAGNLFISTPTLTMMDSGLIAAETFSTSSGHAGNIDVQVGRLTMREGAQISTSTVGSGRGGEVTVAASEAIAISGQDSLGFRSGLFSGTEGQGDGGRLSVSTPLLSMDNSLIQSVAAADSRGNAGGISVQVGRLTLTGGAQIDSSTRARSTGRGGEVTVAASEAIAISGQDSLGFRSGLFSGTEGQGDGGRLSVSTPLLESMGGLILGRTLGGGHAGDIELRVGRLTLTEGAQIFNGIGERVGSQVIGQADGLGRGGNLTVVATDSILIAGRDQAGFSSGLFSGAQIGRGDAGNIDVQVGRLTMRDGGQISTSTRSGSSGRGGELRVTATEAISLTGRGSVAPQTALFSVTDGSGDAGRLFVSAPLLESAGGSILGRTLGGGHAGDIELRVGRLVLTEGAQIFNGTGITAAGRDAPAIVDGLGRGGNLTVVATDSIFIAGHDQLGLPSGLFSSAQIGRGDAGNLFISTPTLTMMDSGLIAAETFSTSSGHAGNIDVQVGRLALSEGAQISSSSVGVGRGGNVTVAGTEHIELSQGGTIAASSSGQGEAGNIVIRAGQLFRSRNGAVTTEAARAGGGSIALHAGRLVQLQDSEVTTSVRGGGGDAGNLTLEAPFVVADGSAIIANAFGGRGGNILINAGVFLADPASLVSASSALGIQGTVDIQAPVTSLSGTLAPLPQAFVHVAALLPARCAARWSGGQASSLVLGGREGLPADPGGLLPSPLVLDDRLMADPAMIGAPHQQTSAAKFALLAGREKGFPRLGCPP